MFVSEDRWHDVRPIERQPQLLELRWQVKSTAIRLYFDEPAAEPGVLRGLHAHVKIDLADQDDQIDRAEKVRVEGTNFM